MTITTLIGLTDEEYWRASDDHDYELFQLEEIARHYKARMRRREQKREIMKRLTFDDPSADYGKYRRRYAKLNELDAHDDRDRKRWHGAMSRIIDIGTRWNAMTDERDAYKKAEQTA